MAKGFGVSPITNIIYYGDLDRQNHEWKSSKEDVTNDAIAAVFEWFMANMIDNEYFTIRYPNTEFELTMKRKNTVENI